MVSKVFLSVQPHVVIDLKSPRETTSEMLTRLEASGLKTVSAQSLTEEQMSVSALEQLHPSDGWTRWLRLVAASTTQLLSAATLSQSPYKLRATTVSLTGGEWRSHHSSIICLHPETLLLPSLELPTAPINSKKSGGV